jgi:hypothetical protein
MQASDNSQAGPKRTIYFDRTKQEWVFDATLAAYDKKNVVTTAIDSGNVYHVSPTYAGNGFVTIETPICFCSGLYVNVGKNGEKTTVSASIWLYRDWSKDAIAKKPAEELHEQLWHDLHQVTALLDKPEYADIKAMLGIKKSVSVIHPDSGVRPFVRLPEFRDGENKGEVDPTRPPRIKANVWLAKPKGNVAAKAKAAAPVAGALRAVPTGDKQETGMLFQQRLLCTVEELDGTPLAIEELYEQPFLGKFRLVWCSDFFGAKRTHQLKIARITRCKKLEKAAMKGMSEAERNDAMEEYAALREEDELQAATGVKLVAVQEPQAVENGADEDAAGEEDATGEDAPAPAPPAAPAPKKSKTPAAAASSSSPSSAVPPKPAKTKQPKTKIEDLTRDE